MDVNFSNGEFVPLRMKYYFYPVLVYMYAYRHGCWLHSINVYSVVAALIKVFNIALLWTARDEDGGDNDGKEVALWSLPFCYALPISDARNT